MAARIDTAHEATSPRAAARAALEGMLAQLDTAKIRRVHGSGDVYFHFRPEEGLSLDLSLESGRGHMRFSPGPHLGREPHAERGEHAHESKDRHGRNQQGR